MIQKINLSGVSFQGFQTSAKPQQSQNQNHQNSINQLSKTDVLASLKSTISFNGLQELNAAAKLGDEEASYLNVGNKEVVIDDILNLKNDLNYDNKSSEILNDIAPNGLSVRAKKGNITVLDDFGNHRVFVATFKEGTELPKVTYSQGKYKPEVLIEDPKTCAKIKMFAGSKIKADNFEFVMPGKTKDVMTGEKKEISFMGKTLVTTLNKEEKTINAVNLYINSDLQDKKTKGFYEDLYKDNDINVVIPAGGFGTRFYNMTRENENKPSCKMPTSDNFRIMATALNMASSLGKITTDDVIYISENPENGDDLFHVEKHGTDGGAIYEAINNGIVDASKDMVVLNSDIISNADITRAYHALKTLPNAAFVIPFYPVDEDRAKSFGLMGVEFDEKGNMKIDEFIEKPKYTTKKPVFGTEVDLAIYEKAQKARVENSNMFYGNPGIYLLSKEALSVLNEMGIKTNGKDTGLGKHIMPEIVKLCNEGKLIGENGEPMVAYTVPLQRADGKPAFWDDLGSAEAYLQGIKDIAKETITKGVGTQNKYYGLPNYALKDFAKNVDKNTGIVFMNDVAKRNLYSFCNSHNVNEIEGNIFVTDI